MKKVLLSQVLFFIQLFTVSSQVNLVTDPSFESVDCNIEKLTEWRLEDGVPFNECFPQKHSPAPNLKPPIINPNPWGFSDAHKIARTGTGFIGLYTYTSRTYAKTILKQELKRYKTYYVRFYIAPYFPIYDWVNWSYNDAIALVVSSDQGLYTGTFNPKYADRPVLERRGTVLKDTMNWTKVSGSFNARGQEKYLIIGNVRTDDETKIELNRRIPTRSGAPNIFFVDDVVLSEFDPLPDTAILCANGSLAFDAKFYDATYRWSDYSENSKLTITKPGSYWVQAKIDGILLQDEITVIPEKEFEPIPKDTVLCRNGTPIYLSVKADAKYKWSTGSESKDIVIESAGKYTVTLTTPQCVLKFSTNVKSKDCDCDFYAPNIFSPNGDGANDSFKPFINCKVVDIENYRFSIFNRFGNLIYTTTDVNESWDGTYIGKILTDDVFAWFVEYNTILDKKVPYKRIVESGSINISGN